MGKKWRHINDRYVYKPKIQLGQGGNARVYLAKKANQLESEELALKILDNSSMKFNEKIERFKIETNLVMEIQNQIEGIIPIYDFNFDDDGHWYIMPKAISIIDFFKESNDIDKKVRCILEISKVLSKLHSRDIVHRDIKPSNIYIYNKKYAIGDFGLVDYPDKNDLTRADEPIGAKATIAPEMKRDSKNADGKKADVYSLAKTLWMLLTDKDYAFEGVYNPDSEIVGLRKYTEDVHLVELEKLLIDSTQYEPYSRPNMNVFTERLDEWLDIYQNFERSNRSQWRYIQERLFVQAIPKTAFWDDIEDIINVLNLLGNMPNLNHMFIPTGGGQDLNYVEMAGEEGCLLLRAGGCNYVLKPANLIVENVDKDFEWSYFRLELENLDPIYEESTDREYLTEDVPGNYISWKCGNYGYYEDDTKLPHGYKMVDRFLKGSFVFFSKASPYNKVSGAYDARHNNMNASRFRKYIEKMKEDFLLIDYNFFKQKYNPNPFKKKDDNKKEIQEKRVKELIRFENFIKKDYCNWDFNEVCQKFESDLRGSAVYSIEFILNGGTVFEPIRYLSLSGKIEEEERHLSSGSKENKFLFGDFQKAVEAINDIKKYIKDLCKEKSIIWDETGLFFTIELFNNRSPKHLFTKKEIEKVLRNGDDSKNNILVIDSDGYAHLIEDKEYIRQKYSVCHESYNAFNNYVGKYSSLSGLDSEYISSLQGWLRYLKSGRRQYIDYVGENTKEDELIAEIMEFYK